MLLILFCCLICVYEYIYVRSNLAVVVLFTLKSESKRSPGTNFAAEDTKEQNIRAIFVYSCEFRIETNSKKTFEYSKFRKQFEYSSYTYYRPVDISYLRKFDC